MADGDSIEMGQISPYNQFMATTLGAFLTDDGYGSSLAFNSPDFRKYAAQLVCKAAIIADAALQAAESVQACGEVDPEMIEFGGFGQRGR